MISHTDGYLITAMTSPLLLPGSPDAPGLTDFSLSHVYVTTTPYNDTGYYLPQGHCVDIFLMMYGNGDDWAKDAFMDYCNSSVAPTQPLLNELTALEGIQLPFGLDTSVAIDTDGDSFSEEYSGFATVSQIIETPEPTTVVLLGIGLIVLVIFIGLKMTKPGTKPGNSYALP
jgi:hypothetical protein